MTEESMNLTIFDPIRATLAKLEKKNKALVFDHTTPEGEKDLRSWVKRIREFKGNVARAHKETKAEALAFGRKVDAIKNELTAGADRLIKERMKPLDEIEANKRAEAEAIVKAEEEARLAKEAEEKAELERREAEVAKKEAEIREKERAEREKRIAEEAAENARKEAEAKAEREKQEAIEAEKEKARQAEAERLAKVEAEKAEKARLAEEERKRIENEEHRSEIEHHVLACLCDIIDEPNLCDVVFDAIKTGKIDHVTINY
jgi:hypothetical protein